MRFDETRASEPVFDPNALTAEIAFQEGSDKEVKVDHYEEDEEEREDKNGRKPAIDQHEVTAKVQIKAQEMRMLKNQILMMHLQMSY